MSCINSISILIGLAAIISLLSMHHKSLYLNGKFLFIYIFVYSLISGFRNSGVDTAAYIDFFNHANHFSLHLLPFSTLGYLEVGYNDLMVLAKSVGLSAHWFYGITTMSLLCVQYVVARRFFSQEIAAFGLLLSLFTFTNYEMAFNQVRQGTSFIFVLIALVYAFNKKPFKSLIFVFIASLFHASALAFLPLALLGRLRLSKKYLGFCLVLIPLFYLFPMGKYFLVEGVHLIGHLIDLSRIGEKINFYATHKAYGGKVHIGIMLSLSYLGLWVMYWMYDKQTYVKNDQEKFIISLIVIGYLFCAFIADFSIVSHRLGYFFDLLYPFLVATFVLRAHNKWIYFFTGVFYLIFAIKILISCQTFEACFHLCKLHS